MSCFASMPDAIVHIGLHKTGTTSIQAWLGYNRAVLSDRGLGCDDFTTTQGRLDHNGFVIASAGAANTPVPPHILAMSGLGGSADQLDAWRQDFEKSLEATLTKPGLNRFVISSETFSSLFKTVAAIRGMDSWFRARFENVRYLVYLRRQDHFLESQFFQQVKYGLQDTLEEFVRAKGVIDYHAMLNRWTEAVGAKRLTLRLYAPSTLKDGNAVADFADQIDTPLEGTWQPPKTNASYSPRAARLIAWSYRQPWLSWLSRKHRLDIARRLGGRSKIRIPEALRQEVLDRNADANERLRSAFFADRADEFARWTAVRQEVDRIATF